MLELNAGGLRLTLTESNDIAITDIYGRDVLKTNAVLLLPKLYQKNCTITNTSAQMQDNSLILTYTFDNTILYHKTIITSKDGYFELVGEFECDRECMLNTVELFAENTMVNMHKLINFRNRHCTEQTYPDLPLGSEFSTTTYSSDWQFAPHPSMFLFTKNDMQFFLGALDLPDGFGLYLSVDGYMLNLYENFGEGENGLPIKPNQKLQTTKYMLFANYTESYADAYKHYTDILIRDNYIPNPNNKVRHKWHRENLYCTWIDQGYLTNTVIPNELHEQIQITANATNAVSQQMVFEAAEIIEREKLPFRTILVDMGWAVNGEWVADPVRFPNFRGMVDILHQKGFKVVIWWNWAEVADNADIPKEFLAGGGKLNKHGQRTIDFSNPHTQENYLKPLFHRLFSGEDGCYNCDGVKTDFLSDKVHPELNIHNPSWRGEERYFFNITKLFYKLMRSIKPDAVHIGCAGHPYLAEYIDINRTYDVWSTSPYEHVNRGEMLKQTSIGCPVAYDFHHFSENLELYFMEAIKNNCSVQIGNIMGIKPHPTAAWQEVDSNYFDILRRYLPLIPRTEL